MRQMLKLKTEDEPKNPLVSTDNLFGLETLNENFKQISELRDLFSILFKPSFLLELKEETKTLEIFLDEEEKKLILKLKKKTKSKSLAKKGRMYALRKEWRMLGLTLVYNLQSDYEMSKELQMVKPVEPVMNVMKPLKLTQPKTIMSGVPKLPIKTPFLIDYPDNITIVLPMPEYTEKLLQELTKISYEKKFRPFSRADSYSEIESILNTDNYQLGPEKVIRPEDLVKQYKTNPVVQTPTQNFERQFRGIQFIRYDKPRFEDGEYVYQKIRMRATKFTTVYELLRNSGIPFKEIYSKKFNGVYIKALNGASEGRIYWEFKINGQYATTTVDKAIVPPGAEVTWVLKTAKSVVCGQPVAG